MGKQRARKRRRPQREETVPRDEAGFDPSFPAHAGSGLGRVLCVSLGLLWWAIISAGLVLVCTVVGVLLAQSRHFLMWGWLPERKVGLDVAFGLFAFGLLAMHWLHNRELRSLSRQDWLLFLQSSGAEVLRVVSNIRASRGHPDSTS